MIDNLSQSSRRAGFALIMSLLVVSVVITAGLTILDVSIKQVRLSGNAKDSETAFSAANAGLECGRYWRRVRSDVMENTSTGPPDNAANMTCFGTSTEPSPVAPVEVTGVGGGGRAYVYDYRYSWGSGVDSRCSKITTMVIVSGAAATSTISLASMQQYLPGYPGSVSTKSCPPSGICTVLSSRGYNRSCISNSPGTIEREVLLEY
jgi:hypothetical protein